MISFGNLCTIPSFFYLFGQKITVEWVDTLVDIEDVVGLSIYRRNVIQLQKSNNGVVRPMTQLESTFLHELMHYIFFMLGKDDLRKDEELVDTIARLLHQAMTTAEYGIALVEEKTAMSEKLTARLEGLMHYRRSAIDFMTFLDASIPECREKSLAVKAFEEAMMWAMKGLSLTDAEKKG